MKTVWLFAAAMAMPSLAYGASGAALLARVPAPPTSAQAAYGMWVDRNGGLTLGAQYQTLEAQLQQALATGMPGQDPVAAQKAQDLAKHYATPQGQAELKAMSMAQKMALAQQMQDNLGGAAQVAGPASPADIALAKEVRFYPATVQTMQKTIALQQASAALEARWDKDSAALDAAASAEQGKLAACHGEVGDPSALAIKGVQLKYADRKIALADSYLPKFAGFAGQYRQTIAAEVAYGDGAADAWTRMQNGALKSQTVALARGAASSGVNDVVRYLDFVEDFSKKAAGVVADKKRLAQFYADAKGC